MTEKALETLVDEMSLAEQVSLLSGVDFWSLPAIPRLGIGKLRMTDGPNGARGSGSFVGGVRSAAFPVGICLGASWDPDLVEEIGAAIAEEVRAKGAHVSLAPTVNIHRSVTNGRNFECYSEDPELTAALAVGYVRGLQGRGVAATVKHFAGNESEIERTTMNSEIDEVSLREIYLRPFEAAVREAGAWTVMSSYNRLNGTYTSEHPWLLGEVLRGDWGFDGVVMSDWFGSHSTAPTIIAGLDLEMPGPPRDRGEKLAAAVEAGEIPRAMIRDRVLNVLRLMERTGALRDDAPFEERGADTPEQRALIRRSGAEGAVLLRNEGLLPLAAPSGKIAVIGPNAKSARIMGGGSAQLNPYYAVSPWEGLAARLGEARLIHAPGCDNHRWEPLWSGAIEAAFYPNRTLSGPPVHVETLTEANAFWFPPFAEGAVDIEDFSTRLSGVFVPEKSGLHRFGIHSAGVSRLYVDGALVVDVWDDWTRGRTFFEEGCDEVVGELALEAGRSYAVTVEFSSRPGAVLKFAALRAGIGRPLGDADIAEAVAAAMAAETAILCVGRSGEWDTEGSDLQGIALPGRQDELIRAVLAANPRTVVVLQTGGPVEMPWAAEAPAILQAWYAGQEAGNAIADVLFGDAEPGGRLPQTFPVRYEDNPAHSQDPEVYPGQGGKVRYAEGLWIGYRHYAKHGITPLFPFGHGLSFATIDIAGVEVDPPAPDGSVTVQVEVTNTGARAGSQVIQIYVTPPATDPARPETLRVFVKTRLAPGERREEHLVLTPRDFSAYAAEAGGWRVLPGRHEVRVGLSSADRRHSTSIEIEPEEPVFDPS